MAGSIKAIRMKDLLNGVLNHFRISLLLFQSVSTKSMLFICIYLQFPVALTRFIQCFVSPGLSIESILYKSQIVSICFANHRSTKIVFKRKLLAINDLIVQYEKRGQLHTQFKWHKSKWSPPLSPLFETKLNNNHI